MFLQDNPMLVALLGWVASVIGVGLVRGFTFSRKPRD